MPTASSPAPSHRRGDAGGARALGDRIEALLDEIAPQADPAERVTSATRSVRSKIEELVRLLMELYGAGLERLMEIVDQEGGPAAERLFEQIAGDDLVASLLLLHGLHPVDLETRVRRALDKVRPHLGSHGGDVELLGIAGGTVRLRLAGTCHGCPSSMVTMKLAIEKAIEEAAPEVVAIDVDGAVPPPAASLAAAGAAGADAALALLPPGVDTPCVQIGQGTARGARV